MGCMQARVQTRQKAPPACLQILEGTAHTAIRTRMVERMRHSGKRVAESWLPRLDLSKSTSTSTLILFFTENDQQIIIVWKKNHKFACTNANFSLQNLSD